MCLAVPVRTRGARALPCCTAGRTVQQGGRPRGLRRRRRGIGPPTPPACVPILRPTWLLTCRDAPAPHHRLPEQLIDAHLVKSRTTTDTTATITVISATPTITVRPFHNASRSLRKVAKGSASPSPASTHYPTNDQGIRNSHFSGLRARVTRRDGA